MGFQKTFEPVARSLDEAVPLAEAVLIGRGYKAEDFAVIEATRKPVVKTSGFMERATEA
jgi:hypothetical protein